MADDVAYALLDATRRMSISRNMNTTGSTGTNDESILSSSVGSASTTSGGWFDSWKSNTELDDKTGSLPKEAGSWFSYPSRSSHASGDSGYLIIPDIILETSHGSRHTLQRAFSESEGSGRVRLGVVGGWFNQATKSGFDTRKFSESNGPSNRMRRSSSSSHSCKDVEEAMAGGLSKADIYMPPF
jgi:hypothetical protein